MIKNIRTLLVVLICIAAAVIFWMIRKAPVIKAPSYTPALNAQGVPSAPLLKMLKITGIEHDGTLDTIVPATQKAWLRQAGKERWEMEERFAKHSDEIFPLLDQMGFLDECVPTLREYDYALLLGATVSRVRSRLAHLIALNKQGIKFKKLVSLHGMRALDPKIESKDILLDPANPDLPFSKQWRLKGALPKNESEMVRMVFDQAGVADLFKGVEIVFVDTPPTTGPDGVVRRATTLDTVHKWLESNPKPGTCLAISNQPYVQYQHAVETTYLPPSFTVETVGVACSDETSVDVHLDNVARYLYQERERLKKW